MAGGGRIDSTSRPAPREEPAMWTAIRATAAAKNYTPKAEPLTCAIGAEVTNMHLGVAARDPGLMAEISSLLLQYKVLFFRDQDITRAEHVAFARHFGELEDHPVAGSDPDHPGLVRIYKSPDKPNDRYENAWHCDATWREKPPFGCVLRCVECPPVGGDTMWANMALAYERLPEHIKRQIAGLRARHSIEATFGAGDADRAAARAQGSVSRRRASGRAHPSRDRGENPLRQRVHDPLHQFPHRRECALRTGLCARCPAAAAIPDRPGADPRIPGALPLAAQQCGVLGQSFDAALRGHGLRALPPQDGARRHHRRHALLKPKDRRWPAICPLHCNPIGRKDMS